MKRTIALLTTAALTFCLSACSTNSNLNKKTTDSSASSAASEPIQESNSDNWNKPESREVSSDLIQTFADYNGSVPLLVLQENGNQRVSLCSYAFDDGNIDYFFGYTDGTLTEVEETGVPVYDSDLEGGWRHREDMNLSKEDIQLFDNALEGLVGVNYSPIAVLATQVVAGTNYAYLCEATPAVLDSEPFYAVVVIYEDLSGNTEISDIVELGMPSWNIKSDLQ